MYLKNPFILFLCRHKVLEDIKAIFTCSSLEKKNYDFDLFKMETDNPNFDKFEDFFDDENDDDVPELPNLECEWRRKSKQKVLLPLEAGVMIIIMDVPQFTCSMTHRITLHIAYSILDDMENSKLLVNVADFTLASESMYNCDLIMMEWKEHVFKNVLALTSVSEFATFKLDIREGIEKFLDLLFELNMKIIKESSLLDSDNYSFLQTQMSSNTKRQYFLQCSKGFFDGVSLRFKHTTRHKIKAKVYVR